MIESIDQENKHIFKFAGHKVTVVLPVYNEKEESLSQVLKDLEGYVDTAVLVDDGSKIPIIKYQLPNTNYQLSFLRHQINRGQGAALQTGTDFAILKGADIIIHFDSDGQHQAKDIPVLIKPILNGAAKYVFGSKILGSYQNMPWTKRYIFWPVSKIIDLLFTGLNLTDVHSGLRAFHKDVAGQLYLSQDQMAHATEYPMLVKKYKISYTEVPVNIIYHKYGRNIKEGFKILKDLLFGKMIK